MDHGAADAGEGLWIPMVLMPLTTMPAGRGRRAEGVAHDDVAGGVGLDGMARRDGRRVCFRRHPERGRIFGNSGGHTGAGAGGAWGFGAGGVWAGGDA